MAHGTSCVDVGHVDNDHDGAVQPQAVPGPVSGACLHAHAHLHYLMAAQPNGLLLGVAGWDRRQGEQLDADRR